MFRETLQTLACLSVLAGTYSLHMARDSYRRPLDDLDALDITDNTPQLLKHNQQKDEQQENDISIGHINLHHSEPPRELQELFGGSSPLDIRLQQQQPQQSQSQLHQNQNKRGSTGNSGGSSVSTPNLPAVPHGMASQLMLRSARGQRQYDVPQIGE